MLNKAERVERERKDALLALALWCLEGRHGEDMTLNETELRAMLRNLRLPRVDCFTDVRLPR